MRVTNEGHHLHAGYRARWALSAFCYRLKYPWKKNNFILFMNGMSVW